MEKRANNTNVNNSFITNQYQEMSYSTGASHLLPINTKK